MRILTFGSTIKKTIFGAFRALRVDDDGYIVADIAKVGGVSVPPGIDIKPIDGGGQRISISSSANRSTQLTIDKLHHISSAVDCWIVMGNISVDAVVGADCFLPAGVIYSFTPDDTSQSYISTIRDLADYANGLRICRVQE